MTKEETLKKYEEIMSVIVGSMDSEHMLTSYQISNQEHYIHETLTILLSNMNQFTISLMTKNKEVL